MKVFSMLMTAMMLFSAPVFAEHHNKDAKVKCNCESHCDKKDKDCKKDKKECHCDAHEGKGHDHEDEGHHE